MGCTSSTSVVDIRRTLVKSGSTIVIWSISQPERELIKRTWRLMSRKTEEIGAAVFLDIFQGHPNIHQMFGFRHVALEELTEDSGFKRHVNRVMQTIGALVDNIEDLDTVMAPVLIDIGKHHARVYTGFDLDLCDVFTASFLKIWKRQLRRRYHVDMGYAWRQVFDFATMKIGEGFRAETTHMLCED